MVEAYVLAKKWKEERIKKKTDGIELKQDWNKLFMEMRKCG